MSNEVIRPLGPLTELKQLPAMLSNASPSKRTLLSPIKSTIVKRFKQSTPPSPHHANLSEIPTPSVFKVPAFPPRIRDPLTPSTSTVAFSSSPGHMLSSSPVKSSSIPSRPKRKSVSRPTHSNIPSQIDQTVLIDSETTLIFGRHRHRQSETSQSHSSTNLVSTIPSNLIHLIDSPLRNAQTIHLSRHASHASRVHAAVEYLINTDQIRIVVLGQNGLRVKSASGQLRLVQGQRVDLVRPNVNPEVEIDFYGCKIIVQFPLIKIEEVIADERQSTPLSSPRSQRLISLPPSSPPLGNELGMELETDEEDENEVNDQTERNQRAPSSPLTTSSEISDDEEQAVFEDGDSSKLVKIELLEKTQPETLEVLTSSSPISNSTLTSVSSSEASPVKPEGIDLPALLASTVVFSGSSKLSLPDLVKAMLESQPSLKEHGNEAAWSVWAGEEIENNEMFGKVSRVGKDASGHPLLPHYFYNPDLDPDTSRARQLGSLVRPLRAAQRAGGKAIDWRPVGSGRRRY